MVNSGTGRRRSSPLGLVEVVEEALFNAGRVWVVFVKERLVDQVLPNPLEGVFCAVGEASATCFEMWAGDEKWGGQAYSTSHTSFRAFLM